MGPKENPHPRSLSAAEKAANESCLSRLKGRGYVDVLPVSEYLDPNQFRSLRRHELNVLTKAGAEALKERGKSQGRAYQLRWHSRIKHDLIRRYDDDKHDVLVVESLVNLGGWMRQYGGELVAIYPNDRLANMIRQGETLLQDVEPDGLMVVRFPWGLKTYLLEADTGSQDLGVIKGKAVKYGRYLSERFSRDVFFDGYPQPQVLFVTALGGRRVEGIKEAIFDAKGRRAYWCTSMAWITPPEFEACGSVWYVPTMDGFQRLIEEPLTAPLAPPL